MERKRKDLSLERKGDLRQMVGLQEPFHVRARRAVMERRNPGAPGPHTLLAQKSPFGPKGPLCAREGPLCARERALVFAAERQARFGAALGIQLRTVEFCVRLGPEPRMPTVK